MLLVLLAAACMSAGCASGVPRRPVPWWASVQAPGAIQATAFRGAPGSASDRCVQAGHRRDIRSGGFLAGPFGADEQNFGSFYRADRQHTAVKVYWIPLRIGEMAGLTIHATRLATNARRGAAAGPEISRTSHQTLVGAAGHFVFYQTQVPIPAPGTWKLVAVAGPNHGCFIATFR